MNINFSAHAFKRVDERLSMSPFEVRQLIIDNNVINIGNESGTNREHLLFYSRQDKECHVIIYDRKAKHVVTVLPIHYHNICAWVVTDEAQLKARSVYDVVVEEVSLSKHEQRQNHRLCILMNNASKIGIGTIPHSTYGTEYVTITQDRHFLDRVKERIIQKIKTRPVGLNDVYGVTLRKSKKRPIHSYSVTGLQSGTFTMTKIN